MPHIADQVFSFEGYTLDLRRGSLRTDDYDIELRPKSFAVLRYLVENSGRLVAKDELMAIVWPNVTVTDESLTRCISDVRIALNDHDQQIIKTMPTRGYLFAAPVSARAAVAEQKQQALPSPSLVVQPFVHLDGESLEPFDRNTQRTILLVVARRGRRPIPSDVLHRAVLGFLPEQLAQLNWNRLLKDLKDRGFIRETPEGIGITDEGREEAKRLVQN
ncbi:MAG: winged helix-turn-helix domain-containing protein [Alphaproteobacteria bacterium]|nr:winged helix-turn-helix domain-containing protein [Alphaproteobacteria bacterium]